MVMPPATAPMVITVGFTDSSRVDITALQNQNRNILVPKNPRDELPVRLVILRSIGLPDSGKTESEDKFTATDHCYLHSDHQVTPDSIRREFCLHTPGDRPEIFDFGAFPLKILENRTDGKRIAFGKVFHLRNHHTG
jgi:hypothetical protein